MLSERITVTTTPLSLRQLIATARGTALANIPDGCVGFMLRCLKADTKTVTITDAAGGSKPATVAGAIALQPQTEEVVAFSAKTHSLGEVILTSGSDFTINCIVNQRGGRI